MKELSLIEIFCILYSIKRAITYRNILLCILCLLSSCGYRMGQGSSISSYQTISVPFVAGDWDGSLTSAIVREVSQSGNLTYQPDGGALTLDVKIIDISDENIGFRYDRKKDGKLKNRIIPDEARTTQLVEVSVIETGSGRVLLGPSRLAAEVDFDHDYYSSRNGINICSLGQLTDVDEAQDAALRPLNQRTARKIVDYILDNW